MKNTHPVEVIPILGSAASSPTLLAKNVISIGSTFIEAPVLSVTKIEESSALISFSIYTAFSSSEDRME